MRHQEPRLKGSGSAQNFLRRWPSGSLSLNDTLRGSRIGYRGPPLPPPFLMERVRPRTALPRGAVALLTAVSGATPLLTLHRLQLSRRGDGRCRSGRRRRGGRRGSGDWRYRGGRRRCGRGGRRRRGRDGKCADRESLGGGCSHAGGGPLGCSSLLLPLFTCVRIRGSIKRGCFHGSRRGGVRGGERGDGRGCLGSLPLPALLAVLARATIDRDSLHGSRRGDRRGCGRGGERGCLGSRPLLALLVIWSRVRGTIKRGCLHSGWHSGGRGN